MKNIRRIKEHGFKDGYKKAITDVLFLLRGYDGMTLDREDFRQRILKLLEPSSSIGRKE